MLLGWMTLTALALLAGERLWPGRSFPVVRGWWPRALLLNGFQVAVAWAAPRLWDGWLLRQRPYSAEGLGTIGGALIGYAAITFVYYWWHRWRH
jgi:hypothetical protein